MKTLSSLAAALLVAGAGAQSQLNCFPAGAFLSWLTPPPVTSMYFDLSVATTITLQAIATPLLTTIGVTGQLQVYLTIPPTTTYVFQTFNPSVWTLAASGTIIGNGTAGQLATITATSCQTATGGGGLVLNPGNYGVCVRYAGVNPMLTQVSTAQTFFNSELSVSGGALQYTPWGALQPGSWAFYGSLFYTVGSVPHGCAEATKYGAGCYSVSGSAYQEFNDTPPGAAASASAALTGRSLKFTPSGGGYVMTPGTAAFIPPVGAVGIPAGDDFEYAITPTNSFPYPGGVASQLFVHSNGYVSVASNNVLPGGPNDVPEPQVMLSAPATAWWSWHDFNPTESGSGTLVWQEIGSVVAITWPNVESYPTGTPNPSTLQFQFDTASGEVTILWQTVTSIGGSGLVQGDDWVIGYSPGGVSPATTPFNIVTLTSRTLPHPEVLPLTLTATAKPLLGTTFDLMTTNETGVNLGINFLSLTSLPAPGVNLGSVGMPNCFALLNLNNAVGNLISNLGIGGTSMAVSWPLPSGTTFLGIVAYSQSLWIDPAANPFGALVSNGLKLSFGNY